MRRLISKLAAGLLVATAGACHRYVPVGTTPEPGADVRVELSESGRENLAPVLGTAVTSVEGRVVSLADTGLRLAVTAVRTGRAGGAQPWEGEGSVMIPPSAYREVNQRKLARRRTALLAGGIAVGAAVLAATGIGSDEGGGGGPGPPPPPPP